MPLSHQSLLVLTAALLPTYLIRFTVFNLPTNFLEVAIWLLLVVGLLQPDIRASWQQAFQKLPKGILVSSFLFLVSAVISTVVSPHLETSLGILKGWIVTPMVFAFMVYASIGHWSLGIGHYTRALLGSGVVMALLGLSQVGQLDRIRGVYDVPNSLALFLAPLVVLATAPLIRGERGGWDHFNGLAAVVMFLALLFTQSVAGVLSVVVVISICLVIRKFRLDWSLVIGHWSFAAAAIFLTLISFFFLAPKVKYLLQPTSSAAVRVQLWSISWDLIRENPILGIGLGTFEPAYQKALHERFANHQSLITNHPEAAPPLPEFVFRDPHNWLLSFWLNTGLLGLISFIGLNVAAIHWSLRNWSLIGHWPLVIGVLGALCTLLLFGLFDTIYWKNDLAALHLLLVSLALLGYNQGMKKGQKNDMPRRQTLFWDVDPATIDPEKHARYVIERILDFGHDDEVRWMWEHYSPTLLRSAVEQSRVLHPPTRVLWQALIQNQ